MMERRPLGEMLTELLDLSSGLGRNAPALALRSVSVTLPIEVALRRVDGEWELLGDVPRMVTRTAFDGRPGRIEVLYVRGDAL
jgi:hypothetical protein